MGPASTAPPAKQGGGAAVIIGVVLLLGLAGGLLYWKNRGDETKVTTPASGTASASTTAAPETTLDLPPIDLPKEDAGDTADTGPKAASTNGGGGGCPTVCTGQINDAIKAAAAARAGTAKKCYQTALEGNEGLAGEIVVQLRIGTGGETCSAGIVSNSTNSGKLAQCVRSKMLGTYPQPKGGCVELKVPVVFKPKT